MGSYGPKKKYTLTICDQQGGEGFNVQVTQQVRLVFDVQPSKPVARVARGHLLENLAVVTAQAAPVGA